MTNDEHLSEGRADSAIRHVRPAAAQPERVSIEEQTRNVQLSPDPVGEPDTYTWLLTTLDGCPACGTRLAADVLVCNACGRSFAVIVRPAQRSRTTVALIGAWGIGMAGAALALIGVGMQLAGITPQTNTRHVLLWIAGVSLVLGSFTSLMAWGCWGRRVFALYTGIALSLLFGLAGVGAGIYFSGQLGLILAIVCILSVSALLLMHLAVAREFIGERRRAVFPTNTTSAIGFHREGRAYYESGLLFLAAQRWARALGKDPANTIYLQALGLVLAKLGHYDRALSQIERALQSEPDNQQIRESYELVRRQATSHRASIVDRP
jgi:hypothetical protein